MSSRGLLALIVGLAAAAATACGGGRDPSPPQGLAFILAGQDGLSRLNLAGERRTILKWQDQSYPLDPATSPDGKHIAFGLQLPARTLANGVLDFGADLYVVGSDGRGRRLLLEHQKVAEFLRAPAWLSDSTLLYTYRGRDAAGLADLHIDRLDLSTGQVSRITDSAVDPAVSKDGKRLVYVAIDPLTQEERLTVAGVDLREKRAVVTPDNNLALFSAAAFLPDGASIAFAAVDLSSPLPGGQAVPSGVGFYARHPFAQDVWLVNYDGSGLRRLAEIAENMPSLTWSGDGKYLYALGPGSLWRIDPSTGSAERIGPGIALGQIVWLSGE